MAPGVYYIDQSFIIQKGSTLNALGGVTIIINGSFYAGAGSSLNITANSPSTGSIPILEVYLAL